MQIVKKQEAIRVLPTNRQAVVNAANKSLKDTPYYHLLLLLAEGCDANGKGINFYATFGATKKGDALSLSINLDSDRQVEYAGSLADLASATASLHDPL